MSWIKLDDQFSHHPKVIQAGPLAGWLHVCALCYCAQYLTDGFIPNGVTNVLADYSNIGVTDMEVTLGALGHDIEVRELVDRLVEVGLWEQVKKGYLIHDYLEYNPSKAQVLAERAKNAERQGRYQAKQKTVIDNNAVTNASDNASVTGAPYPYPYPYPIKDEEVGVAVEGSAAATAAAIKAFENTVGLIPGARQRDEIVQAMDDLIEIGHPEWWTMALKEAEDNNARSWNYVRSIVSRCLRDGSAPGSKPPSRRNGNKPDEPPETADERRKKYIPAGYEDLLEH